MDGWNTKERKCIHFPCWSKEEDKMGVKNIFIIKYTIWSRYPIQQDEREYVVADHIFRSIILPNKSVIHTTYQVAKEINSKVLLSATYSLDWLVFLSNGTMQQNYKTLIIKKKNRKKEMRFGSICATLLLELSTSLAVCLHVGVCLCLVSPSAGLGRATGVSAWGGRSVFCRSEH